jgi:predicted RNA-binding protein with TRAM domain
MIFLSKRKSIFLNSIKIGDSYGAKVEEIRSDGDAIVNFKGNLVRVKNKAGAKVGDFLTLRVKEIFPNLVFEIHSTSQHIDKRKSSFEISG